MTTNCQRCEMLLNTLNELEAGLCDYCEKTVGLKTYPDDRLCDYCGMCWIDPDWMACLDCFEKEPAINDLGH